MSVAPDYCAAKAGVVGLTNALALSGNDVGTKVNAVMPTAYTRATAANLGSDSRREYAARFLSPDLVAPIVVMLAHERCPLNGATLSSAGGFVSYAYLGLTEGVQLEDPTPEAVLANVDRIMDRTADWVPHSAVEEAERHAARLGTTF